MDIFKNRQLLILYHLILSEGIMTVKELSEIAKSSEKTIKNDIVFIHEVENSFGFIIKSIKAKGYQLKVVNSEKFDVFSKRVTIMFNNIGFFKNDSSNRINEVQRILMVAQDYVTLEAIADMIHVSRSTIKLEFKEVKEALNSFNLKVEIKPGYGIIVTGSEFAKRLCMIELYEVHYHEASNFIKNVEYNKYFEIDEHKRQSIRKVFLDTLRQSENSIPDSFCNRIWTYLVFIRKRIKDGHKLEWESFEIQNLKEMEEYHLAKQIFRNLNNIDDYCVDDNEVFALELMLLIWNDISSEVNIKERYKAYYQPGCKIVNNIIDRLNECWHLEVTREPLSDELLCIVVPILIQIEFKVSRYRLTGAQIEQNGIKKSPLSLRIAQSIVTGIDSDYGWHISEHDINGIAVRLYALILRINFEYKQRKLIVCSSNGYLGGELIKKQLVDAFPMRYFESIEIYPFYEVRKLDPKNYDYLILNFGSYSYRYQIPFIAVYQLLTKEQLEKIFYQVIMPGYNLKAKFKAIGFDERKWLYTECDYENRTSFIDLLAYKKAQSPQEVAILKNSLNSIGDTYISDSVLTIVLGDASQTNTFEIYKMKKLCQWQERLFEYVVFVCIDFNNNFEVLKLVELFTSYLCKDNKRVEEVISAHSFDYFMEMLTLEFKG